MLDSHAHILSRDTQRFPPVNGTRETAEWLHENGFEAEDLLSEMDAQGIDQALVVQRGQFYGSDNSYVCAAAEGSARLHAVCGADSRSVQGVAAAQGWVDRGAVGLRLMGRPNEHDLGWLSGDASQGIWRLCAERGIPLCIHLFRPVRAQGLADVAALQQRFGLSAIVIDHLAASIVSDSAAAGIDEALQSVADIPAVALKFTTIPLGGLAERGIDSGALLEEYIALFGEDRLIWGSDITQSKGSYAQMVALARAATRDLAPETAAKLLGDNARRIYRID